MFHDSSLARAFPPGGANAAPLAAAAAAGLDPAATSPRGPHPRAATGAVPRGAGGVRVFALRALLAACTALRVRRSLAVEVKVLRSDGARAELIAAIRGYREAYQARAAPGDASALFAPLGSAGIIAFPHHFAACFGEFGGPEVGR